MNFEYLSPVDESLLVYAKLQINKSIGQCIEIYTTQSEFPNLENKKIAIIGVEEDRGSVDNYGTGNNLDEVRKEFYKLYPGNWPINVADLGNIKKGNSIKDEGMPKQWETDSATLDIPIHSIDIFRFNAICSQTVFSYLIDIGDVSDYVISCMYEELCRINTWQYASNKFLKTDTIYGSLSALMEYGEKPYIEYHDFTDLEMQLRLPVSSGYEHADVMTFQVKTNYKLPRLIGIACKKAALNNLEDIDSLLGIAL